MYIESRLRVCLFPLKYDKLITIILKGAPIMIQNKKIAAVCVAEMQNDDIQSILYPLNEALSEIGWRMIIFDSCTDFFLKNAFDEGEAHLFQLLNHDYIDAVLIMSRTIKNDEIQNQIINRARQNGTPVLLIDSDTRPEGTIQISFDESDAFERLVLHLVEDHLYCGHQRQSNLRAQSTDLPGNTGRS